MTRPLVLPQIVTSSTEHDLLPLFNWTMAAFVIPITVTTLGILTVRSARSSRRTSPPER